MPEFTITLSDKVLRRLQAIVATYNEKTEQDLTVQQWVTLNLKDIVISQDLSAAVGKIQEEQQAKAQSDLQTAIEAKRQEILKKLQ